MAMNPFTAVPRGRAISIGLLLIEQQALRHRPAVSPIAHCRCRPSYCPPDLHLSKWNYGKSPSQKSVALFQAALAASVAASISQRRDDDIRRAKCSPGETRPEESVAAASTMQRPPPTYEQSVALQLQSAARILVDFRPKLTEGGGAGNLTLGSLAPSSKAAVGGTVNKKYKKRIALSDRVAIYNDYQTLRKGIDKNPIPNPRISKHDPVFEFSRRHGFQSQKALTDAMLSWGKTHEQAMELVRAGRGDLKSVPPTKMNKKTEPARPASRAAEGRSRKRKEPALQDVSLPSFSSRTRSATENERRKRRLVDGVEKLQRLAKFFVPEKLPEPYDDGLEVSNESDENVLFIDPYNPPGCTVKEHHIDTLINTLRDDEDLLNILVAKECAEPINGAIQITFSRSGKGNTGQSQMEKLLNEMKQRKPAIQGMVWDFEYWWDYVRMLVNEKVDGYIAESAAIVISSSHLKIAHREGDVKGNIREAYSPQVGHCDTDNEAKGNKGTTQEKSKRWTKFVQGAHLLTDGHVTEVYNIVGTPPNPGIQHVIDIWERAGKKPPAKLVELLHKSASAKEEIGKWGPLLYASQKRRSISDWKKKFSTVVMNGCIPHGGPGLLRQPSSDNDKTDFRAGLFFTASRDGDTYKGFQMSLEKLLFTLIDSIEDELVSVSEKERDDCVKFLRTQHVDLVWEHWYNGYFDATTIAAMDKTEQKPFGEMINALILESKETDANVRQIHSRMAKEKKEEYVNIGVTSDTFWKQYVDAKKEESENDEGNAAQN